MVSKMNHGIEMCTVTVPEEETAEAQEETQPFLQNRLVVSNNITHVIDSLLASILGNQRDLLKQTLRHLGDFKIVIKNYKCQAYNNKTLLVIAAINENVEAATFDVYCAEMDSIDDIDETHYGWEPIHYVARTANPEKLEVLLKYIPKTSINSLTFLSENALHVLLQYEKSISSFNILLCNKNECRPGNIIPPEKKLIIQCAKLLAEKGVKINHASYWNETPIGLVIEYRYITLLKELIAIDCVNLELDDCYEFGQPIKEYIKFTFGISLQQCWVEEDPIKTRFNYLKAGDEENFLKYDTENINKYANSYDGDNLNNSCGRMLHFCVRKGYVEFLRDPQSKIEISTICDIMDSPMLNIFKAKGLARSILYLLDNGAQLSLTSRKFPETLLEYSVLRGYYPVVSILLQHKNSTIDADDIFYVFSKMVTTNLNFANQDIYKSFVLRLLLNKLVCFFEKKTVDQKLNKDKLTVLNDILLHLKFDNRDLRLNDIVCQILYLGGSLTASKLTKNNQMQMVVEHLNSSVLKCHFDDCLQDRTFQYESIIHDDYTTYDENLTLKFLATDAHKQKLLCHPLLIELVRQKWPKIRFLFVADLIFYSVLLFSICLFMIFLHFNYFTNFFTILFYYFFIFLVGFHVVKEAFQLFFLYRFVTKPSVLNKCASTCDIAKTNSDILRDVLRALKNYIIERSNQFDLATMISCIVTLVFPNVYSSVVAIISATFIFFIMLGQVPALTKYTIVFSSIKYFVQYTGFYFILFVSFSVCFYIVFPLDAPPEHHALNKTELNVTDINVDNLNVSDLNVIDLNVIDLNATESEGPYVGDVFKSLFYTIIYFSGEFSDRVLEPTVHPIFGRIVMTFFVFFMTIILNNLLVSLIITDMREIEKRARLYKQIKLISFIEIVNTILKQFPMLRKYFDVNVFNAGDRKKIEDVEFNNLDDEDRDYLRNNTNKQSFNKYVLRDLFDSLKHDTL